MEMKELSEFYKKNYVISFFRRMGESAVVGDVSLGCRFCGKPQNETTFSNESHAIPYALGNKRIIVSDECDVCNKFFSEGVEDHLDKYTMPIRTMQRIPGRRKIPKYKSEKDGVKASFSNPSTLEILADKESAFISNDDKNLNICLNFNRQPYRPIMVYGAFLKMAFSVMDRDILLNHNEHLSWLMSGSLKSPTGGELPVVVRTIPGPNPNGKGYVMLLTRSSCLTDHPFSVFVIALPNTIYNIPILRRQDSRNDGSLKYTFYEVPYWHSEVGVYGPSCVETVDFSGQDLVVGEVCKIAIKHSGESGRAG